MARVFQFEEIKAGQVPEHSNFTALVDAIRGAATHEQSLLATTIFGSYLKRERHDFSRRSDLDVVIVYDHQRARDVHVTIGRLHEVARSFHVPLNLVLIDDVSACSGNGFFPASLLDELRWSEQNGGLIDGLVTEYITEPTIDAKTDARIYASRMLAKTANIVVTWDSMTEHERCQARALILSSPFHVIRKVLRAREFECIGMTKSELITFMHETTSRVLGAMLRELGYIDKQLTDATHVCARDPQSVEHHYRDIIRVVDNTVPLVHHLFWRIANEM